MINEEINVNKYPKKINAAFQKEATDPYSGLVVICNRQSTSKSYQLIVSTDNGCFAGCQFTVGLGGSVVYKNKRGEYYQVILTSWDDQLNWVYYTILKLGGIDKPSLSVPDNNDSKCRPTPPCE